MDKNIRVIGFSLKFIRITLEKRMLGFMMTVLGIIGLLLASFHLTEVPIRNNHPILSFAIYGVLGLLFFFAGIGLIRSTRDLTADSSGLISSATEKMNGQGKSTNQIKQKIEKAPF